MNWLYPVHWKLWRHWPSASLYKGDKLPMKVTRSAEPLPPSYNDDKFTDSRTMWVGLLECVI